MTALIVIGAIALFIFILLASSVRVDLEYDRVFKFRVKYLFFTFVKNPLSPRQIKKKKKKEKEQKKKCTQAKQEPAKEPQKPEVIDLQRSQPAKQEKNKPDEKKQDKDKPKEKPKMKFSLDLIRRIVGRASPHVKRIFKKIRLSNVLIDITTGGDDAAKVAISYGIHCSAVYGLITFLDSVISFKADRISVKADFDLPKTDYCVKATLKFRLSTLLHSGIWGFFAVLSELRKDSMTAEKTAPKQKKAA